MTIFRRLRGLIPKGRPAAKQVRIVTDSTADLPPEIAKQLEISVVPLQVIFGEETFRDGVDLKSEEFFQQLQSSKEHPRTSQPSLGDFQQFYERLAAETDRILSIHLSSRLSGTVETARQAALPFIGRCEIDVLDSRSASMAMGLAVMAAARAARAGSDLATCAAVTRSVLQREEIAVALDTLEYLRRGGRIGRAQAFLGGILRLKPILSIRDGEVHPISRVRTRRKALDEVLRICTEGRPVEEAAIMHATTPDDARRLADEVAHRWPGARIHIGRFGPVLGAHGGPGLIGVAVVLANDKQREAS
ncbi:MAG: DegV family protein [Dehalococcoidia bacterium]